MGPDAPDPDAADAATKVAFSSEIKTRKQTLVGAGRFACPGFPVHPYFPIRLASEKSTLRVQMQQWAKQTEGGGGEHLNLRCAPLLMSPDGKVFLKILRELPELGPVLLRVPAKGQMATRRLQAGRMFSAR
eukprot:g13541.t1